MPSPPQSFASSPARVRSGCSAQAAAAQAVLEKPKVDALFAGASPASSPSKQVPRALSRTSYSEPLMSSSFRGSGALAERANASELSVATTAFLPGSQLGTPGSALGAGAPDALASALADAAAGSSSPPKRTQNQWQMSLPYRTEAESSVVSDWKMQYWNDVGKGVALSRGLRFQDLRYGNSSSAGVCVLKQRDDVPNPPGNASQCGPVKEKQVIIDAVTQQLLQMGVALTEPPHGPINPAAAAISNEASPSRTLGRRTNSEGSIATVSSHHERRRHLCATVARDRYQTFVIAKPKKGHRFCEPEPSRHWC